MLTIQLLEVYSMIVDLSTSFYIEIPPPGMGGGMIQKRG